MSSDYEPEQRPAEVASASPLEIASPTARLAVAGAAVVISLIAFVFGTAMAANVVGYVIGSVVAFAAVALFRRASLERLFTAGVAPTRLMNSVAVGILVLGLICACMHAYLIARHFG